MCFLEKREREGEREREREREITYTQQISRQVTYCSYLDNFIKVMDVDVNKDTI